MNVNRASTTTNYVMVPKTSVANISEVDDNLSSVGPTVCKNSLEAFVQGNPVAMALCTLLKQSNLSVNVHWLGIFVVFLSPEGFVFAFQFQLKSWFIKPTTKPESVAKF